MQAEIETRATAGAAAGGPEGALPLDGDLAGRFRSLDNLVYLLPLRIETLKERGYTFKPDHEADLLQLFGRWSAQREGLLGELENRAGDTAAVRRVAAQIGRFETQFRSHEEIVSRAEELYDQLEDSSFKLEADERPRWVELGAVCWQRRRAQARIFATNKRIIVEEVEGPGAGKGFNRVLTSQLVSDLIEFSLKTPLWSKRPNLVLRFPDGKLVIQNVDPELWMQRLAELDEPEPGPSAAPVSAMPPAAFVSRVEPAAAPGAATEIVAAGELSQQQPDWLERVLSTNASAQPLPSDYDLEPDPTASTAAEPDQLLIEPSDEPPAAAAELSSSDEAATEFLPVELVPELEAFEPELTAQPVVAPPAPSAPAAAIRTRPRPRAGAPKSGGAKTGAGSRSKRKFPVGVAAAIAGLAALGGAAAWWWLGGGRLPWSDSPAVSARRAAQPVAAAPESSPTGAAATAAPAATEKPGSPAPPPAQTPAAASASPAAPTAAAVAAAEPEPIKPPPPPVERRIVEPETVNRTLADRSSEPDRTKSSEFYYIVHLRNGEHMTVNWYRRTGGGIRIPLHRLGEVEIADSEIERIETRRY